MTHKNEAASTTAGGGPRKSVFEIRVPDGSAVIEHAGVAFSDGVGFTDDPIKAHACLELPGCAVTKAGKPWQEPQKAEKK